MHILETSPDPKTAKAKIKFYFHAKSQRLAKMYSDEVQRMSMEDATWLTQCLGKCLNRRKAGGSMF